ncbi:hypothetical protein [Paenibacillus bovis]|uniref:Uncharacterized protein n=1 Tax=Paenibacillus bovis TaxID=1616788 RepID=A0A1X9T3V1_9BACL|nr:hypothetical protein [Paenibacillus bovis]ARR10637.1 hypothetical protein AR543_p0029 [Paenibacillus bovis]
MTQAIPKRNKPIYFMAPVPSQPPRYVFAWESLPDGTASMTIFCSTLAKEPALQEIAIFNDRICLLKNGKMITRKLFKRVEYDFAERIGIVMDLLQRELAAAEVVHVLYQPLSHTQAAEFKLYHQKGKKWDEYTFLPPNYSSESFDHGYFIMKSSENNIVEVSSLLNTNADIAVSLGHGFLNSLQLTSGR